MFNYFVKKLNNRKGFTLVELAVVIAILGILAAIAVPKLTVSREKAETAAKEATERTINGAWEIYNADEDESNEWPGDYLQNAEKVDDEENTIKVGKFTYELGEDGIWAKK